MGARGRFGSPFEDDARRTGPGLRRSNSPHRATGDLLASEVALGRLFRIRLGDDGPGGLPRLTSVEQVSGRKSGNPTGNETNWADGDLLVGRYSTVLAVATRDDGTIMLVLGLRTPTSSLPLPMLVEVLANGRGRLIQSWAVGGGPKLRRGPNNSTLLVDPSGSNQLWQLLPNGAYGRLAGNTGSPQAKNVAPLDDTVDALSVAFVSLDDAYTLRDGTIVLLDGHGDNGTWNGVFAVDAAQRIRRWRIEDEPTVGFAQPWYASPAGDIGVATGLAQRPDGRVLIAQRQLHRIVAHAPAPAQEQGTFAVPEPDGSVIHRFSGSGQHLSTTDPVTGHVLLRFRYDAHGRLTQAVDADGRVTDVERPDASTVILRSPAGPGPGAERVVTTVHLDANGYASSIDDPRGSSWALDMTSGGMLERFWTPRGNAGGLRSGTPSRFVYTDDSNARRALGLVVVHRDSRVSKVERQCAPVPKRMANCTAHARQVARPAMTPRATRSTPTATGRPTRASRRRARRAGSAYAPPAASPHASPVTSRTRAARVARPVTTRRARRRTMTATVWWTRRTSRSARRADSASAPRAA